MLQKLQNNINENFSFLKGKKLLLAVSGGIDSVVLLHLFSKLPFGIGVAHCNFQLRGSESDEDEKFVKELCEKLQVPVYSNRFETKVYAEQIKQSIQIVARNLRYDWFETLLQREGYDYLLTAHHLDDSLETFLINLTRSTGLNGLMGIPAHNDRIVRPLLKFSRIEIEEYANVNSIIWREDSSNTSDKYLRNKIRHDIVPVLKELNPSLLESFENTLEHLEQAQSMAEDASQMVFDEVVTEGKEIKINIPVLLKYTNYKAYLYHWLNTYGFTAWEDIYDMVHAQSGKRIFAPPYVLLKDRDFLLLHKIQSIGNQKVYQIDKEQAAVKVPLNLNFCKAENIANPSRNSIFADEEKLRFPLTIRKWQEGDVFFPFGMKGKKKLSKYFKDEKFSLIDKENTWLLCSDNQIVWVIGKRQDERFKVTENTTKILQINYTDE